MKAARYENCRLLLPGPPRAKVAGVRKTLKTHYPELSMIIETLTKILLARQHAYKTCRTNIPVPSVKHIHHLVSPFSPSPPRSMSWKQVLVYRSCLWWKLYSAAHVQTETLVGTPQVPSLRPAVNIDGSLRLLSLQKLLFANVYEWFGLNTSHFLPLLSL